MMVSLKSIDRCRTLPIDRLKGAPEDREAVVTVGRPTFTCVLSCCLLNCSLPAFPARISSRRGHTYQPVKHYIDYSIDVFIFLFSAIRHYDKGME